MKRAQRTDLLREMKKSFNRYISILLIMALGVAFYAGVRSAEPDMQLSAKDFYDSTDFMDIRVLGTLGMTEDDVAEIQKIEGIDVAEGGYQTELFLAGKQKVFQMKVYSMGDALNHVHVTGGRVPTAMDECFVDEAFMVEQGYQIGDVITLKADDDTEMSDVLHTDTFTIVGYGTFPTYLSWNRGAVSIGTGVEDGFLFLPKKAFSMEVFTVVYATVEGAKEYNPYQEDYENLIEGIVEKIEAIADARCEVRFDEVTKPYWDDIQEAETEIADGEKEIADGEKELEDAEKELLEAEEGFAEAETEIADGEKKIEDGEKELLEAETEIADGEKKLADAEKEWKDAEAELLDGEKKFLDGEKELADAEKELAQVKEQLADGRSELEAGKKTLALQEEEWNQAKAQMEAYGMPLTSELLAAEAELTAAKQMLIEKEAELKAGEEQAAAAEAELAAGREQLAGKKEQLAAAKEELEAGWTEIEKNKSDLAAARVEVEDGRAELEQSKLDLEEGRKELADAKQQAEDAKVELADAKTELEKHKNELEDGKLELADAKKELEEIEMPEWYVLDRNSIQQFVEYGMDSERIGNLGNVFPAVFYLVAALVSLTTMTRMIEEERTQIGTMKALGYGKGAIVSKYLWYSLSATLLGGAAGVLVGSYLFPWVIINAYGILYSNIPNVLTPVQWDLSIASVMIAVVCTIVATLSSCYKEMMAAPAVLMRPTAPAAGKRVFLEYVKPIWNHLSFSWKATCRNLFRYKKRFFMTIFGIGGCMALLLVGFGLQDSIGEIVNNQYKSIWTYDAYISVNSTDIDMEEKAGHEYVQNKMFVMLKTLDAETEAAVKSVSLFVPERLSGLEEFLKLKDRVTGETYTLTEEGVIISEKLANMLEVSVGDEIEIFIDDITKKPVTVQAIAENYMSHYIYMSMAQYEELYEEEPEFNQLYLKLADMTKEQEAEFSREMLSDDEVDSVTYVHELQETVSTMMESLKLVIVVLIVAAGMLAFIVLFNLNNINIIERRRELATLKVLGFYDGEVGVYVYRENVLLTVFGILAGIIMGIFLHKFVILTVEIDMIMFGRDISVPSYLYSVLLTCVFAVIINFGMFFKLRKIDMVESLKSAE